MLESRESSSFPSFQRRGLIIETNGTAVLVPRERWILSSSRYFEASQLLKVTIHFAKVYEMMSLCCCQYFNFVFIRLHKIFELILAALQWRMSNRFLYICLLCNGMLQLRQIFLSSNRLQLGK